MQYFQILEQTYQLRELFRGFQVSPFEFLLIMLVPHGLTSKTDGACPPNFEVSVSNLEFSQTRYEWEFQRFPPTFSSSKKYSREPFNFPLNIQFFIWSLCRCTSPRCCFKHCSSYHSGFGMLSGTESIYISTASLQELKELGKYKYFFRVYHNNETD